MAEAVTTAPDRPQPKQSNGAAHGPALVSGGRLAIHFGCTRQAVGGADMDVSRLRYIGHLRAERQRSPRSTADAESALAKAELVRLRVLPGIRLSSSCAANRFSRRCRAAPLCPARYPPQGPRGLPTHFQHGCHSVSVMARTPQAAKVASSCCSSLTVTSNASPD